MTLNEVTDTLVAVHREYQDHDADRVTPDVRPLADLEDFDSDFIPEIVRRVASDLGYPLPKGTRVKNIYVEDGRKLTIREAAKNFLNKYAPTGAQV